MYRIRFHGRGGHGVKTAGRILGTALFREGFQVQDAPRYGAERRGAPIFAHVRADRAPILERGVIGDPDLVVVIDETLPALPAAGVRQGIAPHTVVVIHSARDPERWRKELGHSGPVVRIAPAGSAEQGGGSPLAAAACTAAAARLLGVVGAEALERAVREELGGISAEVVETTLARMRDAYRAMEPHAGAVGTAQTPEPAGLAAPEWVQLSLQPARVATATIHTAATSALSQTGLWRTLRPEIDLAQCHRCIWVCGTHCPDNAILGNAEDLPYIDYDHCKGCLICLAQCPSHAITTIWEHEAAASGGAGHGA
jgi:pyruvate ferredoxin oxidoreductase gamma subunit